MLPWCHANSAIFPAAKTESGRPRDNDTKVSTTLPDNPVEGYELESIRTLLSTRNAVISHAMHLQIAQTLLLRQTFCSFGDLSMAVGNWLEFPSVI